MCVGGFWPNDNGDTNRMSYMESLTSTLDLRLSDLERSNSTSVTF